MLDEDRHGLVLLERQRDSDWKLHDRYSEILACVNNKRF